MRDVVNLFGDRVGMCETIVRLTFPIRSQAHKRPGPPCVAGNFYAYV